jgi:vacuolar protein sorting-associated protein 13A/C
VGGIGKGVKSLVTNVVSGSFDSISKISGSLYSVVKSASGSKNVQLKKPDHVFDGIFQGVKGGMTELVGGVTGVFTKPIEKTREEGAKGTVKGIGQGLFGLVSAPITATLRLGSSVASGVSSSATSIGNHGKDLFENT